MSDDWTVWVFLSSTLLFVVTELIAVFNRRTSDTASERVWALPRPLRYTVAAVAVVLGGWLGGHFAFGWWS